MVLTLTSGESIKLLTCRAPVEQEIEGVRNCPGAKPVYEIHQTSCCSLDIHREISAATEKFRQGPSHFLIINSGCLVIIIHLEKEILNVGFEQQTSDIITHGIAPIPIENDPIYI